ncbi:unnamed protein product [Rotaria sordida]|uniref:Uncharacterized protein n=1 Tax=Rotaria sordida TaxID=392033 RepID=A0A813YB89_9BILA|nr:unnamed protein product [Rotaria sordida]CAF0943945.1 unnamed protein product [Rotaria sordida]
MARHEIGDKPFKHLVLQICSIYPLGSRSSTVVFSVVMFDQLFLIVKTIYLHCAVLFAINVSFHISQLLVVSFTVNLFLFILIPGRVMCGTLNVLKLNE